MRKFSLFRRASKLASPQCVFPAPETLLFAGLSLFLLVADDALARFSVEDVSDHNKKHIIHAYRAQHSHHRLPWCVCDYVSMRVSQ